MDVKEILDQMTLEEKAGICSGLDFWHFKGVERLGVPALMVCDGPHGLRKQEDNASADMLGINESIEAICFPTASALAASFDRKLVTEVGKTLGKECQAVNISVLLGPGNNIKRSPLCGRNFEYFSEDPYLASEMAAAHISGVQSQGVATSMKHFCVNNQETRRMSSSSNVDERTLREIYLAAFEGAVKKANPRTIMCSYNQINGIFACENKSLLTDILRDEWGFEGIVITDWGAGRDKVKGINAGMNIQMPGNGSGTNPEIVEAVRSGVLKEEKLDRLVEDILNLINWVTEHDRKGIVFDYEADHMQAAETAKECAVLLKNKDQLLPLKKGSKLAFIGDFAERPRYQGSGSSHIRAWKVDSVMKMLQDNGMLADGSITFAKGYDAREYTIDEQMLSEAVEAAANAEAAVIFAGLPDTFESEGFDRKHLQMPDNQTALIHAVAAVQKNVVVVLHNGAPVEMPWIGEVKSVLEMYLGGEGVGRAELELLFGAANPCGKLAETFPLKLAHNPSYENFPGTRDQVNYHEQIYVGYRYYDKKELNVLFPFGHGLSYTTFDFSDIHVNKSRLTDQEQLILTCKIKNTGDRVGKEVVQLYVGPADKAARKVPIPVKALKGFEKVTLMPGEEREVRFLLSKRDFAYYEAAVSDWFVETGDYKLMIGASSRDIRLETEVHLTGTVEIPLKFTPDTPVADIMSSAEGKAILGKLLAARMSGASAKGADALGEGSQELMSAMASEMPLGILVSFGGITKEQLNQILTALNEKKREETNEVYESDYESGRL